jgi:hypothetical protein
MCRETFGNCVEQNIWKLYRTQHLESMCRKHLESVKSTTYINCIEHNIWKVCAGKYLEIV